MTAPFSPVTALAPLRIDVSRRSPGTVRVAAVGEVDMATAPVLHDALLRVLREQAPAVLDVDLADVTFLDCTGISVLVAVRNVAVQAGRQVIVTHPRRIVRRVLDLTGLLDVFTAPIDRPQPPRSDHPTRIGPILTPATQPPQMMAAA